MLCLSLVCLGLVISGYLLARTFALLVDRIPDTIDVCSAIFGASCDQTLLSQTSWMLGIPLAGWGAVYYATLASLLVLAWAVGEEFEGVATLAALVLASAGLIASVVLSAIVIAGRAPLCPLCLVIHLNNLALLPALKHLTGRTTSQLLRSFGAGARYVVGGKTEGTVAGRWNVVGLVTAALAAVVLYQWVLVQSERHVRAAGGPFDPLRVLTAYASTPRLDVPVDADDPRLGPPDAPLQLVVFTSFQCPGCQRLAREIKHLAEHFPGNLAIAFKHYPLGTACNAAVSVDKHPRACEAAWAAEAARRQGGFWPFHDALFDSDLDASEETIQRAAREAGLDPARFEADRHSEATMATVNLDIELGTRLGIDATPTVFLNQRRVQPVSLRVLELLITAELK